MARCLKSGEDECHGHDCIDRIGTPCQFDNLHTAGLEDFKEPEYPCNYTYPNSPYCKKCEGCSSCGKFAAKTSPIMKI